MPRCINFCCSAKWFSCTHIRIYILFQKIPFHYSLSYAKDPDAGKDWRRREKRVAENEIVRSSTQWTWIWANSGREWRTEEPGVVQPMGSPRVKTHPSAWTTVTDSIQLSTLCGRASLPIHPTHRRLQKSREVLHVHAQTRQWFLLQ